MPEFTPRLGLEKPVGADQVTTLTTGPGAIRDSFEVLDDAAVFAVDVESSRPAASLPGRFFLASDTGKVFLDTGSAWVEIARVAQASTPTSTVLWSAASAVPDGWLLADGAAVSRSTYSALFSAIGTTYGAGNGSTTFNVPDLRGKALIGAGQGPGLTNRALGATVGAEGLPSHVHGAGGLTPTGSTQAFLDHTTPGRFVPTSATGFTVFEVQAAFGSGLFAFRTNDPAGNGASDRTQGHTHSLSGNTAPTGSGAHGVMQPSLALTPIIKT